MCNYVEKNKCTITSDICPYVYWCERRGKWKESQSMPNNCGVKERYEAPKGQYRILEERKGYLFVDVDGQSVKIKNPFDFTPKYVKMRKLKNGWKIKE